jgi:hypothetical protein
MNFGPIAVAVILGVGCSIARADDDAGTVRSLQLECNSPDGSTNASLCLGYISGIADGIAPDRLFCPKGEPPYGAMMEVFKTWAAEHPEKADISRRTGVLAALVERWPC